MTLSLPITGMATIIDIGEAGSEAVNVNRNEFFLITSGTFTITLNGETQTLTSGEHIFMNNDFAANNSGLIDIG